MCQTEHCYVAIEELMPNNRFCSKNWQRLDWSETEDLSSVERFPPSQKQQRKKVFPPFLETLIEHTCKREIHYITEKALASRANTDSAESEISQSSWEIVLEICKCVLEIWMSPVRYKVNLSKMWVLLSFHSTHNRLGLFLGNI